jgi:hypothetical protein
MVHRFDCLEAAARACNTEPSFGTKKYNSCINDISSRLYDFLTDARHGPGFQAFLKSQLTVGWERAHANQGSSSNYGSSSNMLFTRDPYIPSTD